MRELFKGRRLGDVPQHFLDSQHAKYLEMHWQLLRRSTAKENDFVMLQSFNMSTKVLPTSWNPAMEENLVEL